MNTARITAIQAAAPPKCAGYTPGQRKRPRRVGGQRDRARPGEGLEQAGMLETGTNTELANTSGKTTTKPADWAASAPRTVKARKAKIQLSANPKLATRPTAASALATPAWKRKPTR